MLYVSHQCKVYLHSSRYICTRHTNASYTREDNGGPKAAPDKPEAKPAENARPKREPDEQKRAAIPDATAAPPRANAKKDGGIASEFAIWGQMILDGKSGKVPNIRKLKLIPDLEKFRVAWEKYQEAVTTYNMTHALQIKEHPLISCVDPELWRSISDELLNPEHMTTDGKTPNHVMVKKYVLAEAPYMKGQENMRG